MSVLCQVGTLVWMTISQATIGSLASLLFLGALASRCSVEHRSSRWKTGVLAKGKTECLAATCVVCRWSATFSHPMVPVDEQSNTTQVHYLEAMSALQHSMLVLLLLLLPLLQHLLPRKDVVIDISPALHPRRLTARSDTCENTYLPNGQAAGEYDPIFFTAVVDYLHSAASASAAAGVVKWYRIADPFTHHHDQRFHGAVAIRYGTCKLSNGSQRKKFCASLTGMP